MIIGTKLQGYIYNPNGYAFTLSKFGYSITGDISRVDQPIFKLPVELELIMEDRTHFLARIILKNQYIIYAKVPNVSDELFTITDMEDNPLFHFATNFDLLIPIITTSMNNIMNNLKRQLYWYQSSLNDLVVNKKVVSLLVPDGKA